MITLCGEALLLTNKQTNLFVGHNIELLNNEKTIVHRSFVMRGFLVYVEQLNCHKTAQIRNSMDFDDVDHVDKDNI